MKNWDYCFNSILLLRLLRVASEIRYVRRFFIATLARTRLPGWDKPSRSGVSSLRGYTANFDTKQCLEKAEAIYLFKLVLKLSRDPGFKNLIGMKKGMTQYNTKMAAPLRTAMLDFDKDQWS